NRRRPYTGNTPESRSIWRTRLGCRPCRWTNCAVPTRRSRPGRRRSTSIAPTAWQPAWPSARRDWPAEGLFLAGRLGEGRGLQRRRRLGLLGLGLADFLVALDLTLGHGRLLVTSVAGGRIRSTSDANYTHWRSPDSP